MGNFGDYIAFIWIGFAVFMLICEALTSQLVSIWFVIGGICAAISCIFTDNILIQSSVFIIVSFVCLIFTRPLVKKITKKKIEHTNSDSLIGRMGLVRSTFFLCFNHSSAKSANLILLSITRPFAHCSSNNTA